MKAWILAALLSLSAQVFADLPVSVLYKRESGESALRLDSAVQSALQTFEEGLIESGYAVIQPDPQIYAELDKAAGVVITFAPDAGYSVTVDVIKSKRANPGTDQTFAEVRLKVRAFNGRRVLASLSEYAQIAFRPGAEEKAFEATARRAVQAMVPKLAEKLAKAPPAPEPVASSAPPPRLDGEPLPPPSTRWAILFGVSDFSMVRRLSPAYKISDLPGVAGDMKLMLTLSAEMGIPADHIIFLFNKDATTANLRKALNVLAASSAAGDQVMVYLSAHGMPKAEGVSGLGYPVTYDTRIGDRESIIDFEEIQNKLKAFPAQRILWLADTCHSGGAAEGLKVVEFSTRNIGIKKTTGGLSPELAAQGAEKDFAVLTAARADQAAIDDIATGNGLFTFHFANAVRKGAKRTLYRVYKEDLESVVPQAAKSQYQHVQQPGFARSGRGDLITF